ncbi:MAG: hypothetical protein KJ927_11160 [Candidatus Eisenbacteria bacterium]|nr:hypothetical protein [Candidatus Eisenbacteria bacterium]
MIIIGMDLENDMISKRRGFCPILCYSLLLLWVVFGCQNDGDQKQDILNSYLELTGAINDSGPPGPSYHRNLYGGWKNLAVSGAIAATLELTWPPLSASTPHNNDKKALAEVRISQNNEYILAILNHTEDAYKDTPEINERFCLATKSGEKLWVRDFDNVYDSRVSDLGVTAILWPRSQSLEEKLKEWGLDSLPPNKRRWNKEAQAQYLKAYSRSVQTDSLYISFFDNNGNQIGRYGDIRHNIKPYHWYGYNDRISFLPGTNLFILHEYPKVTNPFESYQEAYRLFNETDRAKATHSLRCINTSGEIIWENELEREDVNEMIFARDDSLIVIYGSRSLPRREHENGLEKQRFNSAFYVYGTDGIFITKDSLETYNRPKHFVVSMAPRYLYFYVDGVVAWNLNTDVQLNNIPVGPLQDLIENGAPWEKRIAGLLLKSLEK